MVLNNSLLQAVLAKAETFLMKTDSFDLCKKIDLAHQYVLPRLKVSEPSLEIIYFGKGKFVILIFRDSLTVK